MRRRTRYLMLGISGAAALIAGCGGDDFPNEPRPPAPVELTAKVSDEKVVASPTEDLDGNPIGAGIFSITASNLSDDEVTLVVDGPTRGTSDPIVAGGVHTFKVRLEEGRYSMSAEGVDAKPTRFEIGPERPSAQNDLLLP